MLEKFFYRIHSRMGNLRRFQSFGDSFIREPLENVMNESFQLSPILNTFGIGSKARLGSQLGSYSPNGTRWDLS